MEYKKVKETLGLPNVIYMTDSYDLVSGTLPNRFKPEAHSLLEKEFKKFLFTILSYNYLEYAKYIKKNLSTSEIYLFR